MAGTHTEEFTVKTLTPAIPVEADPSFDFTVNSVDTQGDPKPLRITVHKGLLQNGSTRCGVEDPENNIAHVYLDTENYKAAVNPFGGAIVKGTKVGYLSVKLNGFQQICEFSWRG